MPNYCVMCGSSIPEGQNTCSMCYGDIEHGNDGYYRQWMEEQEQREYERQQEEAQLEEQSLDAFNQEQAPHPYIGY